MEQRKPLSVEEATANDDDSAGPSNKKSTPKKPNLPPAVSRNPITPLNLDLAEESEDESMENIKDGQRASVSSCTNRGNKIVDDQPPENYDDGLGNRTPENYDVEDDQILDNNDSDGNETPENYDDEINRTPQNVHHRCNQSPPPNSPERENLGNNEVPQEQIPHVETPRARRPRFKEFSTYRAKARVPLRLEEENEREYDNTMRPNAVHVNGREKQLYEVTDGKIYIGCDKSIDEEFWEFLKLKTAWVFLREILVIFWEKRTWLTGASKHQK